METVRATAAMRPGSLVVLVNLSSPKGMELNGETGVVLSMPTVNSETSADAAGAVRIPVELDESRKQFQLKAENLVLLDQATEEVLLQQRKRPFGGETPRVFVRKSEDAGRVLCASEPFSGGAVIVREAPVLSVSDGTAVPPPVEKAAEAEGKGGEEGGQSEQLVADASVLQHQEAQNVWRVLFAFCKLDLWARSHVLNHFVPPAQLATECPFFALYVEVSALAAAQPWAKAVEGVSARTLLRVSLAWACNSFEWSHRQGERGGGNDTRQGKGGAAPGGSVGSAMFRICSKLRHSCEPNAQFVQPNCASMRGENAPDSREKGVGVSSDKALIVTLRPIAAGEEITISYLPPAYPRLLRRDILRKQYLFDCSCTRCCAEAEEKGGDENVDSERVPAQVKEIGARLLRTKTCGVMSSSIISEKEKENEKSGESEEDPESSSTQMDDPAALAEMAEMHRLVCTRGRCAPTGSEGPRLPSGVSREAVRSRLLATVSEDRDRLKKARQMFGDLHWMCQKSRLLLLQARLALFLFDREAIGGLCEEGGGSVVVELDTQEEKEAKREVIEECKWHLLWQKFKGEKGLFCRTHEANVFVLASRFFISVGDTDNAKQLLNVVRSAESVRVCGDDEQLQPHRSRLGASLKDPLPPSSRTRSQSTDVDVGREVSETEDGFNGSTGGGNRNGGPLRQDSTENAHEGGEERRRSMTLPCSYYGKVLFPDTLEVGVRSEVSRMLCECDMLNF
uniref:SET domain-containing protein n=1 Tax=Chromera velia CCMP2878 TaxID=1169474 RepID=A0A0G4I375_9ALVE|eukprot:Cvel_1737.t1-p1 / transcript=Cvel_1737.t1 / gene=Cvel_1737 / organism=Chromera_velia_CCMP2878 / gene_product=Potential protein lysine methyltransferase SET5, putative / transcript_product=Potential protein lysine methyltransferase SET5, putative / location=Cvel_scaffold63:63502-66437(+) / protein_length=737 / sequence_SO=supercontig / SO=protein_coding / is_pseudo=false